MRVRGRRRCTDCETEWSYFDTGEIACPNCGGLRSIGVDPERSLHTDTPVDLDLADARGMVGERPLSEVAATAADAAREYVVRRGFIVGGDLKPLDELFLRAAELREVGTALRQRLDPSAEAEQYFLALLDREADPGAVPPSLAQAHGLAIVSAVGGYATDLRKWLDEYPDPAGSDCLDRLRSHVRRANALDGDIPPEEADRLISAARGLGDYLRSGEPEPLDTANQALNRLG